MGAMPVCLVWFGWGCVFMGTLQFLILLFIFRKLSQKQRPSSQFRSPALFQGYAASSLQGSMWVTPISPLELQKHSTNFVKEKSLKDQRMKKSVTKYSFERAPVWKYAKLEEKNLILTSSDGTKCCILLEGCTIQAISGASVSAKKWAKRYPIKVENEMRTLFEGCSICLLYLETNWEKEGWCEALRAATRLEHNCNSWYINLKKEFESYATALKDQSLLLNGDYQRHAISAEFPDQKVDISSSKKRLSFWKSFLKKSSKVANRESRHSEEHKDSSSRKVSSNGQCQEILNLDKVVDEGSIIHSNNEDSCRSSMADETNFCVKETETTDIYLSERMTRPTDANEGTVSMPSNKSIARGFPSVDLKGEAGKKVDEGVLGWNILFSRLFFDLAHSTAIVESLQKRIQKLLSNVPTPSYISGISCTHVDLGKAPPLLQGIRGFPIDCDGVWGVEANVNYSGGAILTIETRFNVRETTSQENAVIQGFESNLSDAATAKILNNDIQAVDCKIDVVKDLEVYPKNRTEEVKESYIKRKVGKDILQESKSSSRKIGVGWKTILSHVAEQVSQVPIILSVRILSLKGTLQVRVKAPPSDRIWFGFSSMPDIELHSEPSIGDYKISTGLVVSFIADRLKVLFRETLVNPNFEDLDVPWMISENDDWLKQSSAPLPWTVPDSHDLISIQQQIQRDTDITISDEGLQAETVSDNSPSLKIDLDADEKQQFRDPEASAHPANVPENSKWGSDLEKPLLETERYSDSSQENDTSESSNRSMGDQKRKQVQSFQNRCSRSGSASEENSLHKKKRGSKRERMLNFGKKIGKKFEEKKRQLVEKL